MKWLAGLSFSRGGFRIHDQVGCLCQEIFGDTHYYNYICRHLLLDEYFEDVSRTADDGRV